MSIRKTIRIIGALASIVFLIFLGYHRTLISYGIEQAKGQLSIIWNSRPIEEVLKDPATTDSVRQNLEIVREVKSYAVERLGLKKTENYTTYFDQQGKVSLWNLSASEKYQLEPKRWNFPLLGSFPYKGFFQLEKAKKEMQDLIAEGYDARIRPVGGWSTLGWTNDPILSNMLNRPEGPLAELIIHELTHTTLFVEDNIDFNENLASFIGEEGAKLFLKEKYGKNSPQLFEYIFGEEDGITFRQHMLRGTAKLDSLFNTFNQNDPDSAKARLKNKMITTICTSLDTLHFHNARYYDAFDSGLPNNAYFLSYMRYYSAKDSLESLLHTKYDDNLRAFIRGMIEAHD